MINLVNEQTVADAHKAAIKRVVEFGHPVMTEDQEYTVEMPYPLCIHVDFPLREPRILTDVGIGPKMMQHYSEQMRSVTDNSFSYTYGNRLLDYNGIDQLQSVINRLNCTPTSRRAIMHTWMVSIDIKAEHVPCMQIVQFLRRDDQINCVAVFRSNDMLMAWGANAYALTDMLKTVAQGTNCSVGYLETYSISAHVYSIRDQNVLQKVLGYGNRYMVG